MATTDKYPADWKKRRAIVFSRHNYECQDCGEKIPKDSKRELHCHHIRPISEGGGHGLDNLMPLCFECHVEIHRGGDAYDLHPRVYFDCAYCGHEHPETSRYSGSYCSESCYHSHKAEKQMRNLNGDRSICSTCFSHIPYDTEICQNCHNVEVNSHNPQYLEGAAVDTKNLIKYILKEFDL